MSTLEVTTILYDEVERVVESPVDVMESELLRSLLKVKLHDYWLL